MLKTDEDSTREFKVRIVEKLVCLEKKLCNHSLDEAEICLASLKLEEDPAPSTTLLIKDEIVLETMNREYIKRIMSTILEKF